MASINSRVMPGTLGYAVQLEGMQMTTSNMGTGAKTVWYQNRAGGLVVTLELDPATSDTAAFEILCELDRQHTRTIASQQ
jgi:hypothetical protein